MDQTASLIAWSFGIAAGGYALFVAFLLSLGPEWRHGKRPSAMLLAGGMSMLWGATGTLFAITGSALFLFLGALSDILRYGSWFVFLILLLTEKTSSNGKPPPLPFWLPPACALTVLTGLLLHILIATGVVPAEQWSRGILFQALAMNVLGMVLLEQLFRNVTEDARWNVKPLCLGLGGLLIFDLYLYSDALMFSRMDADAFAVRGFVNALIIPLLVVSTLRSRDWTQRVRLSQRAAFHSATLLMAGVYLLFMSAIGYYVRYFGGDWGRALQLGLLFAALIILGYIAVSGSMRAKLRVMVGKHFFSYRYDYREEWLRFTRTLATQDSPQAIGQQVIRGLANMVESPGGALWLQDSGRSTFSQTARWNTPQTEVVVTFDTPLIQFLLESGWIINLEEYRCYPGRYGTLEIPEWLSNIPNAWLIVPLMVGSEIHGFVVLTSARTPIDINWEVNDLLRTAGCQAAGVLAKMQATEALLESRKFDAFNKMSAFVVHDLKNIVTQLSLMLRNAERHRDNPEFQQDMLMTVEHAVERMRQLMMQLREGATPPGTPCGVSIPDVIERIQRAKLSQGRTVDLSISEPLTTRGHEERLERVIGHMVQNAIDATPPSGRVWISLSRKGDRAALEVGDTGHGMSQEFIRHRLFKPFQSTKSSGMGIGAYESAQYIRELGGEMLVESEEDSGTRITMLLPLFEIRTESDLKEQEAA